MQALEKILEEIENESKLAHEKMRRCASENPLQFDEAKGYARGVEYVAEIIRSHMNDAKDTNDDWIPVEEGLPGDREEVEVTIEVADSAGGMRYYTKRAWIQDGRWIIRQNPYEPRVIAWQPLPESYKSKKATAAGMEHIMSRFMKTE